jgi:hypothetical protein
MIKTIGTQTRIPVVWLSLNNGFGTLTKDQAVLYMIRLVTKSGEVYYKLGQVTKDSAEGLTPAECFEQRYPDRSHSGDDIIAEYLIVIDKTKGTNYDYDNAIRQEGHRLYEAKAISFDCLFPGYQLPGYNTEAVLGFKHEDFDVLLNKVVKPALGITAKIDTRQSWIPRDMGTPVGQDLMVSDLASVVLTHKRGAFAGYTGVGKSHLGIATAHTVLEQANAHLNGGGLVLITTPIVDTAQSFEDNIARYRYGTNRTLPVSLYRQDILETESITDLRQRADSGELIFLLLTVQDVRYKDESGGDIRAKYQDIANVTVDVWIRDEFHKEYGGVETSRVVDAIEDRTTYLIDLSATLRNVIEQGTYHLDQIVNRNFFWALENKQHMLENPVPDIKIKLLGDISHDRLPQDIQDMYNPAEGWNHEKLTETVDGRPKQYAGFKGMLQRAYCLEDDHDQNPWTINNDPELCEVSRRVGLWRFPHGDEKISAQDLYVPLAKSLRNEKVFINNSVYITSSWEITDSLPFVTPTGDQIKTADEYVEYLLLDNQYVVILTQTKFCTGSDIQNMGHEVLCDSISSPLTMEQFYPGRVFRRYPGKTDVALYVIAPGVTVRDNFSSMAQSAKNAEPEKPMTEYLRQIQISSYSITWTQITAEEMFGEFQSNLREKIRAEISVRELEAIINNEDIKDEFTDVNYTNRVEGKSKNLTEDNQSQGKGDTKESKNNDDSENENTVSNADKIRIAAQSINAVMIEVPAFAIPENIINIKEAIGHSMIRRMFDNNGINTILTVMDNCPRLHQRLQDKLTEWHSANQNLPYEDIIDQVYKNTERKKRIGLVFIKRELAQQLVDDFT